MNPTHERGFFTELGRLASSDENQLSRTFTACFRESTGFRRRVVELLWNVCGRAGDPPDPDVWECHSEVSTRPPLRGRLDIRIRRRSGWHRGGHWSGFSLENKIAAPLSAAQLERYIKAGSDSVVAITKYFPQVGPDEVRRIGAFALRWQDVHRVLSHPQFKTGTDRLVSRWFTDYLEEQGMAYRQPPTVKQVKASRRIFTTAASPTYATTALRGGFRTLDDCASLLDDVYLRLTDRHPSVASWTHRKGPEYLKWIDSDDFEKPWHAIGWSIAETTWTGVLLEMRIWWSEKDTDSVVVSIQRVVNRDWDGRDYKQWKVEQLATHGRLDPDKIVEAVSTKLVEWKVVS